MYYKSALQIGTSEGTVKCTYATIFADKNGTRPLFSLQRKNFGAYDGFGGRPLIDELDKNNKGNASYGATNRWSFNSDDMLVATYTGYGAEGVIGWDTGKAGSGMATAYTIFDFPLVVAKEWSGEQYVPVQLEYAAAAYLKRTLSMAQPGKYIIVYEDESRKKIITSKYITAGALRVQQAGFELSIEDRKKYEDAGYVVDEFFDVSPKYRELRDKILNDQSVYYVKPAAFDWHPTDIRNYKSRGSEELEKAKAAFEQARKMLILAGGAALL